MANVKALFPIGKTQWSKWSDDQRTAFNEARAAGVPYNDAILGANQAQAEAKPKKKSVFDIIEDVAEVAATVAPVVAVVKTVVKKKAK
jgi:BioD-like phosphotransacetylase family protein